MGAEIEAAEAVIRISGAGFTEVMRIVGPGSIWLTKNAVLATVYGLAKGGTARQITRDPSGMGITSVPTDKFEEVKTACKDYKIKFFSRQVDDTYTDICIKNSDLPSLNHILDNLGISAVKEISVKSEAKEKNQGSEKDDKQVTFEDKKNELSSKAEKIGEALNRNTERDFERKEPYFFADIENPNNYFKVDTHKEQVAGKTHTYSTYHCYNKGEFKEEYKDKPVYGKPQNWQNTKEQILVSTEIEDGNLVFFSNEKEFKEYQNLYNSQTSKNNVIDVKLSKENIETGEFKESLFKQLDDILGKDGRYIEKVPDASPVLKGNIKDSEAGQKTINGNTKNKTDGLRAFAKEYNKTNPYPPGLSPKDKERLNNLREGIVQKNQEIINKPVKMMRK